MHGQNSDCRAKNDYSKNPKLHKGGARRHAREPCLVADARCVPKYAGHSARYTNLSVWRAVAFRSDRGVVRGARLAG